MGNNTPQIFYQWVFLFLHAHFTLIRMLSGALVSALYAWGVRHFGSSESDIADIMIILLIEKNICVHVTEINNLCLYVCVSLEI